MSESKSNVDIAEDQSEDMSEQEQEFDVTVSQLKGVGEKTQEKLASFGVTTLYDLCVRGAREIEEITGASKETAVNWVFLAHKSLEEKNLIRKSDMNTLELYEYQKSYPRLQSKCKEVDALFGGGLIPEAIYEIYGEFGCGKTQFCLSHAAEVIARGEKVIWVDCEDTFRVPRLVEILLARGLATSLEDAESMLKNINYIYAPTTEQLTGTVNNLTKIILENKVKLIILDGAIGQFREEYLGRGTLSERQNELARLMNHIKNISYYFRCTVVFTNQVQSDPSIMFGDPIKPIGGNVVAHASTYRIYFKKSGKNRLAKMIDSPEHKNVDASYVLNEKGIADAEK